MVQLTSHGVCYDIVNTPFKTEVDGFEFHFSSVYHLDKFLQNIKKQKEWLCDSLSNRFRFQIDAELIALFQLYNRVETRGFYVVDLRKGIAGTITYSSIEDVKMRAVM